MLGHNLIEEEFDPFVYVVFYFDCAAGFAEAVKEGVILHIDCHIKLLEEIVPLDAALAGLNL